MAQAKPGEPEGVHVVARHRRASFDYEILEKFEAGIVLRGSEVKSIRDGHVSIAEAYATVRDGEAWIVNMDILPYPNAGPMNHEPKRTRKLLLHRREIAKLKSKTKERGLTLVPISLYFKEGLAKLEFGLGKGRKKWDKRDKIKKDEMKRDVKREMGRRR